MDINVVAWPRITGVGENRGSVAANRGCWRLHVAARSLCGQRVEAVLTRVSGMTPQIGLTMFIHIP